MKRILLPLLFLLTTIACSSGQKRILDERTGIYIIFSDDGSVFPSSWLESPINGRFEDLDSTEVERSGEMAIAALNKYPVAVIKRNLRKVYVLKRLVFYDQVFGGTNSTDVVYVANHGLFAGYTEAYMERVFHAEFSSVLLRKYASLFDNGAWKACNGPDINYGSSGVDALRTGRVNQDFDSVLNAQGILNEYSLSDLENDFNAYAQNIFLPKPGFWDLVAKYPAIRKKVNLIIAFYAKLDANFTEAYFRKFKEAED